MEALPSAPENASNGYEAIAAEFVRARRNIGSDVIREWATAFPPDASILDLGCGHGVPISQALMDAGCTLFGIDASRTLLAAFRERFPAARAECCAVEESDFFGSTFDGVVAWGLLFLLSPAKQRLVIRKVGRALKPGGCFVFTSPRQRCAWDDALTGLKSVSLGFREYQKLIKDAGMTLARTALDEGDNHYYFAVNSAVPA